ncbi:MAG: ABC transporter ATP-binding protein [Thermoanaerobaculales bacterium]|nr:ABC transporter ATP-binding protein [Thermoanaerobaculales bacterium]
MTGPDRSLIHTEEATKVYNPRQPDEVCAVDRVTVGIERGEVVALKGPSGSGKTTLLSLIGCMARPTSGRVVVDGRDVARLSEEVLTRVRREKFGFIFQQFNLISDLSALDNVMLPLYPVNVRPTEMRRRAEAALEGLGMQGKAARRVRQLSGGEQQRVAIARALINQPEIIIADEPTAHLDQHLSDELMRILEDLNRQGKTVVISTHDALISGHPIVDRVIAMRDGRVDTGDAP